MRKSILVLIFALFISACGASRTESPKNQLSPSGGEPTNEKSSEESSDENFKNEAKKLYEAKKNEGINFEDGPCLGVIDGWAVDVAHHPRMVIDNRSENQCDAYNSGTVKHFIELDPEGNLIRME